MHSVKVCILFLITISALAQNHPQTAVPADAQPHAQQIQQNQQQVNVQPMTVQPIVVQPVAVQQQHPQLPNVVTPEPIIQAGVNAPMPEPVPVEPGAHQAGTQSQQQQAHTQTHTQQTTDHIQTQPQVNQQKVQVNVQPTPQPQPQAQPEQVIHVSHQTGQQQQQHTQQQQQHTQQQQQQQHSQQQQQHVQPESAQQASGYRRNAAEGQHANNPNNLNYDNPDAERSARYRAEQQRLNQIRRKQKQLQQKRAHQMGVGPNPNIEIDRANVNKNQMTRNKQRQILHNILKDELESGITLPKKTVMFQVDKQIQQYVLNPTSDIEITLRILIYTLENNAYGFVKDVDKSKSLKIYVYEDNSRIVAQTEFYFQTAVKFLGKAGSTYIIRFYNEGVLKLVSLTYPNILEALQMQNLYSKQKGLQQITKTQALSVRIQQVTERLRRNSLMDRINNETMMGFLRKYSGYQFIEMLVVIVVSAFQVHLVKNMFQTDSIL